MKIIEIKAQKFFDLLKDKNTSMWDIFSQLITNEPQLMVFLSEENKVLFEYELPTSIEELEEQKTQFNKAFTQKMMQLGKI